MARGRMIANAITQDKRVNDLSSDTSRLAFTWLVTFADCEGRTHGDPALLRSLLFPRRDDVTTAMLVEYIGEWQRFGLVVWYEAEGDLWIWFPAFEKNQPGLRKDHEQPSAIPAPPQTSAGPAPAQATFCDVPITESLRSNDVVTPAQVNGIEVKVNGIEQEVNASAAAPHNHPAPAPPAVVIAPKPTEQELSIGAVFQAWEDINPRRQLTPLDSDKLGDFVTDYGPAAVLDAIRKANEYGKPFLAYVGTVLKNGNGNGHGTSPPKRETAYDRSMRVLEEAMHGGKRDGGESAGVVDGELAESRVHRRDHPALPSGVG